MTKNVNINAIGVKPYEAELPSEPGTQIHTVRYIKPTLSPGKKKGVVPLARSDILFAMVQVVGPGGETNLHDHPIIDELWFVLEGRARFYGAGNKLIAELGKHEGLFVPRGCPYWFESADQEQLEIVQLAAFDRIKVGKFRVDHEPKKMDPSEVQIFKLGGTEPV
jgi:mannose-6-phosphate isomerase-like protein (cupin superfamily)